MSTLCTCRHLLSWHGDGGCTWERCRCPFVRSFAAAPPPYSATGGNADAPSDQHASICTRTGFHLCVECRSAVPLPVLEDGAVSAIADHSGPAKRATISAADAGGGTDSTEPRRTLHGPTVEAAGDAHPSYDRRQGLRPPERKLVIALAEARLAIRNGTTPDDYNRFMQAADAIADLFPVIACHCCGTEFVQGDARKTMWCSERCRYRISQRARRARLKAAAESQTQPVVLPPDRTTQDSV